MKTLQNKVAAVTGAGSGIGRALAMALVAEGCEVAISDNNAETLAETVRLLGDKGPKITSAVVDVSDRAAVEKWAADVVGAHGRVNLIFNNAGVAMSASIADMRKEELDWVLGVNFWGVVHGTQAFLPYLTASGEGHVVNVSSIFGVVGIPFSGPYNISKYAVRALTECLRIELDLSGAPVTATCVHPGGINTNIMRSGRVAASSIDAYGHNEETLKKNFQRKLVTSPEKAAQVILAGVKRNKRRILIGLDAKVIDFVQRLMPQRYQALVGAAVRREIGG